MVKLRLRRQGRKGKPFYYIVAADARAPRDGRFIERIGSYNPNTNPATIDLNLDDAVRWLENGAVPTDTCRAILSYKGALHKHHLNKGVKKGAMTVEEAEAKFTAWLEEKEAKNAKQADGVTAKANKIAAERLKAETAAKEAQAAAIAAANTPEPVAEEVVAEEAPVEEAATEEVVAEAPAEEVVAETEAPAEEAPKTEEN